MKLTTDTIRAALATDAAINTVRQTAATLGVPAKGTRAAMQAAIEEAAIDNGFLPKPGAEPTVEAAPVLTAAQKAVATRAARAAADPERAAEARRAAAAKAVQTRQARLIATAAAAEPVCPF